MLIAVVTKIRLPQTIGLELAMPGIGVFHLMFLPLATSHSVTARCPSPLPPVASPRRRQVVPLRAALPLSLRPQPRRSRARG